MIWDILPGEYVELQQDCIHGNLHIQLSLSSGTLLYSETYLVTKNKKHLGSLYRGVPCIEVSLYRGVPCVQV